MYGYVMWGKGPGLTAENIGGVWFAVARVPRGGFLAALRRRLIWRRLRRYGVTRCVLPEELEGETARWGLLPVEVDRLRLALLPRLLDLRGDLRRATALLRADCVTADVYRAAAVLAGRVRYLTLAVGGGEEDLARALRQRFGLCTGSVERPAVTVSFGGAPEDGAAICLGPDCRRWQRVTYGLTVDMPGPWPVSEQLLAALWEAGEIKKEQIRVKTIAFNA